MHTRICDTLVEANAFRVYWVSQGHEVSEPEQTPSGYYAVTVKD